MRTLITVPGKFGDILWALATVRQIAKLVGEPVDFRCGADFELLCPLIAQQDYIHSAGALSANAWPIRYEAPIQPWKPSSKGYLADGDLVLHLGLETWPGCSLFKQFFVNAVRRLPTAELRAKLATLCPEGEPPDEAWIYARSEEYEPDVYFGSNESWIELKMGVRLAVGHAAVVAVPYPQGGRHSEFEILRGDEADWIRSARLMAGAKLYVGDLSSQWVLANAMQKPTVIFDPEEARHQDVFWRHHPRNVKVLGADGKPSWDARHVVEATRTALEALA